jgi:hypothetical protein
MIELLALVCTVIGTCKDVSLTFGAESVTPMQCLMHAQPVLAKWAGEHPGWEIKRWSCSVAGRFARA